MRPVTPFMAIRTVLRVNVVPFVRGRGAAYAPPVTGGPVSRRLTGERCSKRFLHTEKLASEPRSGQDRDQDELFEGANNRGSGA
ncbi:hypothetical protein GCM10010309_25370 [Streptomyces violaceochromogenes]|nr:hypothetical protein GCM10010309_25370 [Streptomyces violaceochromogenes]